MGLHDSKAIRFGVNYTPSKRWYYCWNDWDLSEIEEDFDALAGIGADHIRLQLIWPSFQPNPTWVSPGHLARLDELMRAAEARNIDVLVTLFTGFLSGWFFMPPFVQERRQMFVDDAVFEAELLLAQSVLGTVKDRPNFMGFDVGNEINCCDHGLPTEQGDAWANRFMDALRDEMGAQPIVNGIDHTPLWGGSTFSLTHLANAYPITCLHCWPYFTGTLERGDLTDAPAVQLSSFCAEFIRAYAYDKMKPIWIQEFGACDLWGDEAEREGYMRASIETAMQHGVSMFTWWCSHDKPRGAQFNEMEYWFGLFTHENAPKLIASTFRELADRHRDTSLDVLRKPVDCQVMIPSGFEPRYYSAGTDCDYTQRQLTSSIWRLFDAYLAAVREGATPTLAREEAPLDGLTAIETDGSGLASI